MKANKHLFTILLLSIFTALSAGTWSRYPYTDTYQRHCRMGDFIYILNTGNLFRASLSDWQVNQQLTRQDGLSGTTIIDIAYSEDADRLAVVYYDGLIDILHPDGSIWTIPDHYFASMQGIDKSICSIREQEGELFVHTSYGFFVIDLKQEVLLADFQLGQSVFCAWSFEDNWYYSTELGTFSCSRFSNIYAPNCWMKIDDQPFCHAEVFTFNAQHHCWLLDSAQHLQRIVSGTTRPQSTIETNAVKALSRAGRFIQLVGLDSLVLYDAGFGPAPITLDQLQPGQRRASASLSGAIGISTLNRQKDQLTFLFPNQGIEAYQLIFDSTQSFSLQSVYNSPLSIDSYQQSGKINKVAIGNRTQEIAFTYVPPLSTGYVKMLSIPGLLTTFDTQRQQWDNYTTSGIKPQVDRQRFVAVDFMTPDPNHPSRYWFGTLEDGIIGVEDGQFFAQYNGPLTDYALTECAALCTRISGIAIDSNEDIWCINEGVNNLLRHRSASDGSWHSFHLTGLERSYGFTHLCLTRNSDRHQIWAYQEMNYGVSNVLVYDFNGTPTELSDDRFTFFKTLTPTETNSPFTPNYGRDVCEGPDGTIYLLNTSGLYAIDNPDAVFVHPGQVRTILQDVIPTSIAFDTDCRIWVSTEGNGLYLLNAEGKEVLAHYTSSDSPLPKGEIQSIAFDSLLSNLWIVTTNDILAYHYDSEEYGTSQPVSKVAYCYPATVIVGSNEAVTVFGLKDQTTVTVQNKQGRILLEDTALGGLLSVPTEKLPAGCYSVSGTDAEGYRGELVQFTVTP